MNDGYLFGWNNQTYPINLPVTEPILAENDPVLNTISGFIISLITNYLSPSFSQEAAAVGLTTANGIQYVGSGALGSVLNFPLNPTLLQTNNLQFPLVSVYRESEEDIHFTLAKVMVKSNFVINYVLPPLTAPQYNRLYSFLHLLNETVVGALFLGADPLYQNGALVFQQAGLSYMTLTGAKFEPLVAMDSTGSVFFPSVAIRFSCNERKKTVDQNYERLSDFYIEMDLVDGYLPANPIVNFADGYVEPNLTLTGLTVSSGPKAGGTNLFIQGTGLDTVTYVTICGVTPQVMTVKSNSLILISTGATLTAGIGNVVVSNLTGTATATLTNAYTYT